MSYGFSIKNASSHVLVSDEVKTPHFVGKATYLSSSDMPDHVPTSGSYLHRYTINLPNSDTPIVFLRPYVSPGGVHIVGNLYSYSVVEIRYVGGNSWTITTLQSGNVSRPCQLYIFVSAAGRTSNDPTGLVTVNSAGEVCFDSNLNPLNVVSTSLCLPPRIPCDGGIPTITGGYSFTERTLDFDFNSDNTYISAPHTATEVEEKNLLVSANSLTQAVYQRGKDGHKRSRFCYADSYGIKICESPQDHNSYTRWTVMYYSTFRVTPTLIHAGWAPYNTAYYYKEIIDPEPGVIIGIGSSGGSFYESGAVPYTQKTINLEPIPVIISDARFYGD